MVRTRPQVLVVPLLAAAIYACAGEPGDPESQEKSPGTEAAEAATSSNGDEPGPWAEDGPTEAAEDDAGGDEVTPDAPVDAPAHDASGSDGTVGPDGSGTDGGADANADAKTSDASAKDSASDAAILDASIKDASIDVREAAAPDTGAPLDCSKVGPEGEPLELGCTSLYSHWPSRTFASTARAYEPAYRLWSDGAEKARFIELPAGGVIDASNPDEWTFPVGTKLYKEFRILGRRVETRMLWKRNASQWVRVTYAWSYDQTTARVLRTGATDVWGTSYEIPAQSDCETCHMGKLDTVLGFEVVSLSNAGASGYVLSTLAAESRIAPVPTSAIIPGNATEKAALGMLHANCGLACHNGSNYALARDTGLFMRLEAGSLSSVTATTTYKTAVNVPSAYQPSPGAGLYRIKPKDVAHSAIHYRASSREKDVQMPPQETHVVDPSLVNAIAAWINAL